MSSGGDGMVRFFKFQFYPRIISLSQKILHHLPPSSGSEILESPQCPYPARNVFSSDPHTTLPIDRTERLGRRRGRVGLHERERAAEAGSTPAWVGEHGRRRSRLRVLAPDLGRGAKFPHNPATTAAGSGPEVDEAMTYR